MGKGKGTLKSEIKVLKVPSRFDLVAWAFIKFCYLKRRRLLETGQLFGTGSLFFFEKQQNLQTRLEEDAIRLKELCTHMDIILGNSHEDHCFCIAELLRKMNFEYHTYADGIVMAGVL